MHPFSGSFNIDSLAENTEKEYALPAHMTVDIIKYLRDKKMIVGKGDTLHLNKRYSERTVGQLLGDLDNAGRNSDAMSTLDRIHNDAALNHLWRIVNNETTENADKILNTPVREILGIKV